MKSITLLILMLPLILVLACQEDSGINPKKNYWMLYGTITGVDSVTVDLSGDDSASALVKKSGETYIFMALDWGAYTITPYKKGYVFTPSSKTYNHLSANQIQDFEGKPAPYTISGTVTGADSVTVTLSGSASATQTVTNGGTYSFNVEAFGTYIITPSKSGYAFTPPSKEFQNPDANQTQNFEAKPLYTISGTIAGADGVSVTLTGDDTGSQVVNNGGNYLFMVEKGGNYTVIPSKSEYSFNPSNKSFTNISSNQIQNFIANLNATELSYTNCQLYIHITTKVLYADNSEYTEDRGGQFVAKGSFKNGVFTSVWDTTYVQPNTLQRSAGSLTISVDPFTQIVGSFSLSYFTSLEDKRYNSVNSSRISAGGSGIKLVKDTYGIKGEIKGIEISNYLLSYTERQERSLNPNSNNDITGLTPTNRNSISISFW